MSRSPHPERKYIKRREAERFWQFQYENDPIKESKTFYDKAYGGTEASLEAAKKYRDDFLRSAHELGITGPGGVMESGDLPIQLTLSPRNTSGIVGLYREVLHRPRMTRPEMNWIANYKDDSGSHKQKAFSIKGLGEKGALLAALRHRRDYVARIEAALGSHPKRDQLIQHLEDLDLLLEYIEDLVDEDGLYFFLSTLNNPAISATEKNGELAIRIGQARFRRLVCAMWGGMCAVTGATQFLVAGHIKPWSESSDHERLDPYNGLPLSPVYDRAFDLGMITFDETGHIVLSPHLRLNAPLLGITGSERVRALDVRHEPYLQYHRVRRFRK